MTHTHETLDRSDSTRGVGDGLAFGRCADFALAIVQKADYRRGSACAFIVRDHGRFVADHDGDARVGCTEVNADYLSHVLLELYLVIACLPVGGVYCWTGD